MSKIVDINRKQKEKELFDKLDKQVDKLPPERKSKLIAEVRIEGEEKKQ